MLYKIHRRPVESVNTTRRPRWFQPDSGEDVPSMAGTRWTRATGTSSTLFRSKYMARWHSMAIKIIRQANQTGGNGPEIEQVPHMESKLVIKCKYGQNNITGIGFSPIGFSATQAIFNSISHMRIALHSSTSQESTRYDMGGVSIAISNEQQASKW